MGNPPEPAFRPFAARADVDAWLARLALFGIKLGLETVTGLLDALGNPHLKYPSLHVAGTNGKGSTVAFADALLRAMGLTVGRYTSPHLEDFSERIAVAGVPVSDADLVALAGRVAAVAGDDPPPTFFEVGTVMALAHFARAAAGGPVDVAVVETGMGGRLDATNVLTPKVSVITGVSLEHAEHLGATVAEVAVEKAGIIKPGVPVVTGAEGKALAVIRATAEERGAPLYVLGEHFDVLGEGTLAYRGIRTNYTGLTLSLAGSHQRRNAALALAAVELMFPPGVAVAEATVRSALSATRWPGRLESVPGAPPVLMDAAHNPEAAAVLAAYLAEWGKGVPLWLVLGVLADKQFVQMLEPLREHVHHLILTRPDTPRGGDLPAQACVAGRMNLSMEIAPRVADAVALALKAAEAEGGRVCISGSIYTLGEARAALRVLGRPVAS
ncbi:MAG: bifunctional folylpolyglutamate synthase/dihydrofolate synthase [Nitrospirota bacterium]|nr:bifunctional folylpolyglutamate synthase/dihydrofolate synthase [Nitrospirota bacterium]